MAVTKRRRPVRHGAPRKLPAGARPGAAPVDLFDEAEVTLVIRPRGSEEEWQKLVAQLTSGPPRERRYLTRAELARQWGASREDIEAVRNYAVAEGLEVISTDAFRRCVVVSGSVEQLGRAFDVEFQSVDHPLGTFRTHSGTPAVHESIHPLIECILGLDELPVASAHASTAAATKPPMNRRALLDAYGIPRRLRGKGECVAVIELGGGFYKRDYTSYFERLRLTPPPLRTRRIGGVKNRPAARADIRKFVETLNDPNYKAAPPYTITRDHATDVLVEWTIETITDIDVIGTIAPDASMLLIQTSNTDQGHYHAITSALADARNAPSVLSCSWGGAESHQTPALMHALDRWFQAAAVMGITVCVSSGDMGAGYTASKGQLTADFPATSPYVLACGGTTLHPKEKSEVAWSQIRGGLHMSTGGGFSDVFPLPAWQSAAGIDAQQWIPATAQSGKGRAIPDVAAKANMEQGYSVIVGGIETPAGGTSASAPLWAALVAILNQGLKTRVGSLHEALYQGLLHEGLRDIVEGDNGTFHAGKGWDACTGWGSPHGETLLRLLR